ncbi:GntR family transcriptional regulator [Lactiplantibacillus plajomi]|uniref:GntR family transcriptional regulator n=1 Tax=Lactiplantibacillus plajomi TaxID=1457217 RepID=A0ABV6K273_9LACO|nr:GntR family transcriptional regulator [Lactiplantibacillus plajomi]
MQIDHASGRPYYAQLVAGIEHDIRTGLLQPDDRLPSVREMARQHLLNPNTVSKAYKQLEASRVIRTVAGKGTYVNGLNADEIRRDVQHRLRQVVQQAQQVGIDIAALHQWLDQMEDKTV